MDKQLDEQDIPLQWAQQLNTKRMIQAVTLISLENEEKQSWGIIGSTWVTVTCKGTPNSSGYGWVQIEEI